MKKLHDLSRAPVKVWKPLPGGDHNSSVIEEGYFETIAEFITKIVSGEYRAEDIPEKL